MSPGRTGTTRCARIGPASISNVATWTVVPVSVTPAARASSTACHPGKAGSSAGWVLRIRPGKASCTGRSSTVPNPAMTTTSTCAADNTAVSRRVYPVRSNSGPNPPKPDRSTSSAATPASSATPSARHGRSAITTTTGRPAARMASRMVPEPEASTAMRADLTDPDPDPATGTPPTPGANSRNNLNSRNNSNRCNSRKGPTGPNNPNNPSLRNRRRAAGRRPRAHATSGLPPPHLGNCVQFGVLTTADPSTRTVRVLKLCLRPLGIYLASRLGVLLVAGATSYDTHQSLGRSLIAWDANWYVSTARDGYATSLAPQGAQNDLGFFPGLPLAIRAVHVVHFLSWGQAGLVVTFGAGLLAALALWFLLRDYAGDRGADRGTALVFFSPGAFVLSMVYSEGLLIALVACTLLALGRRRWLVAGIAAALATATDPVAAAVIVACIVACVAAVRRDHDWRSLWAPLLAPAGILGFFAFLWVHVGTPLAWFHAQRGGFQGGAYFWGVPRSFSTVYHNGFDPNSGVKAISFLVCIVLVVLYARARPPATWTGYVVAALAMGIISPVIGITPRLLVRCFPLLGVVGARLPRGWITPVVGLSALLMATLAMLAMGSPGFTP